ncbi:MAG: VOC family protein [Myxococcota bacterium]|nr:VOC family protein [Myxococcota bacterium]
MTQGRPFRILGVQQIAVGALDRTALRTLWVDLLGGRLVGHYRSERENVDEDIVAFGQGPAAVEVDLMQPVDPQGRPRVHDPPLHHVGLWVDDLRAAVAWLSDRGVRFAGEVRRGAGGHEVAFIHPRSDAEHPFGGCGVLIELVQAPAEVVRALGGSPAPPDRGLE